jgi:hypothetical protein
MRVVISCYGGRGGGRRGVEVVEEADGDMPFQGHGFVGEPTCVVGGGGVD